MKRNDRVWRPRRGSHGWWRVSLLVSVLVCGVWVASSGSGARADRQASLRVPTLDDLLRQRVVDRERDHPVPPAIEELRSRHIELRERRRRIEESLSRRAASERAPAPRRPDDAQLQRGERR